jgi:hypothetical protein
MLVSGFKFFLYHSTGRSYPAIYAHSFIDCVVFFLVFCPVASIVWVANHFVTDGIADKRAKQKQESRVTGVQK